jgi:hypothetical protein
MPKRSWTIWFTPKALRSSGRSPCTRARDANEPAPLVWSFERCADGGRRRRCLAKFVCEKDFSNVNACEGPACTLMFRRPHARPCAQMVQYGDLRQPRETGCSSISAQDAAIRLAGRAWCYSRTRLTRRPLLAAGSTGRCNTFRELVCWGLIEQGLSGPFIELPCYRAEFGLAV